MKKHPAGLCSGQLLNLEPGCAVRAFIRTNPGFHAGKSEAPLILIGAGTGIGPLAGFVRANARRRPIHLFFGMRHPASDFLYKDELTRWHREGRLHRLVGACSRGRMPRYVQHALLEEAAQIAALIRGGAHHGLWWAGYGRRRFGGACRDSRAGRVDAGPAQGGGTLCRRRLLIR